MARTLRASNSVLGWVEVLPQPGRGGGLADDGAVSELTNVELLGRAGRITRRRPPDPQTR